MEQAGLALTGAELSSGLGLSIKNYSPVFFTTVELDYRLKYVGFNSYLAEQKLILFLMKNITFCSSLGFKFPFW